MQPRTAPAFEVLFSLRAAIFAAAGVRIRNHTVLILKSCIPGNSVYPAGGVLRNVIQARFTILLFTDSSQIMISVIYAGNASMYASQIHVA